MQLIAQKEFGTFSEETLLYSLYFGYVGTSMSKRWKN